jgi:formylglycine-generating enzyme required for sulfatase activity
VLDPANPATVRSFRLDKYDVTVGRFRQFVSAWNNGAGYTPPAGSGKHTHLNGGQGLADSTAPGRYEPGWFTTDNGKIALVDANLACGRYTWSPSAGSNENLPINCVNWFEAYAFCIWDGGFLPSEAEWGYASAGGSQQREYPWGSTAPGTACPGTGCEYAIYGCDYPSGTGTCTGVENIAPVGTATLGAGLWGQLDLQGNVTQWNFDAYATYLEPCADCAYFAPGSRRSERAANYHLSMAFGVSWLLPPIRFADDPTNRQDGVGFRCARAP